MAISMAWGRISLLSVVAFIVGWWIFGLLWAVVIAIIVLILTGALSLGK
ncbi:MAG: hypothetical protein R6W73_00325 [Candidatus Saliniplasma sp.]